MGRDERQLEATGEEAERQKTIAAMAEGLLQRALQRQRRRFFACMAELLRPSRKMPSGAASRMRNASVSSDADKPEICETDCASGTSRTWPSDPPALASPIAMLRFFGRSGAADRGQHDAEAGAADADADQNTHADNKHDARRRQSGDA